MERGGGRQQQGIPFKQKKPGMAGGGTLKQKPFVEASSGSPALGSVQWGCSVSESETAAVDTAPVPYEAEEAAEKALRSFDMDMTYGPCIGLSRKQRWERAERLGLVPPRDLKALIDSEYGQAHPGCLWEGRV